jgi:hypothetical protein
MVDQEGAGPRIIPKTALPWRCAGKAEEQQLHVCGCLKPAFVVE